MSDPSPHPESDPATDPTPTASDGADQGQRTLRLEHREETLARAYANTFRTFTSGEELVIDFGFNLVRMDPAAAEASGADGSVAIDWTQRSVLSYRTAKSLAIELSRVVREHERVRGEIPVQPPQPDARAQPSAEGASS